MAIARSPSQIRTCGTVASGSCLRRQRQAASRDRDELCVQRPMRRRIRSQVMRAVWLRRRSVRYQSRPTWEAERGQCRAVHGHPVVPQMPLDNRAQPPAHIRDRNVHAALQLGLVIWLSFACSLFRIVCLTTVNRPFRFFPQMWTQRSTRSG